MTTNGRSTVVAVFTSRADAENAINDLHSRGFTDQQIGFIARDTNPNPTSANQTSAGGEAEVPTGERAAVGAASGGVVGGLIGAAASLLIPGFGPAIAGGILAATLGGIAIGAAAGGIIGALTHLGVPEEEARYYQSQFEAGRILVTVDAPGRLQEAMDTLSRNGGDTHSNAYDATGARNTNETYPTGAPVNSAVGPNQPGTSYDPTNTYNTSGTNETYPASPASPNQPGTSYDPNSGGTYSPNPSRTTEPDR